MSRVRFQQRYTTHDPCVVCGGYDRAPRGQGVRCFGFRSDDGRYGRCSREEYAGHLPIEPSTNCYVHRLGGPCGCGATHDGPPPHPIPLRSGQASRAPRGRIVTTYPYVDADRRLLYEVVRYEPKAFSQRRPDGDGGWAWNLQGVQRVLYRLPELLAADPAEPVFIVEGEKDADALWSLGLVATTSAQGAHTPWQPQYTEALRGRHVVAIPDDDADGRKYRDNVTKALFGAVASLKVVTL